MADKTRGRAAIDALITEASQWTVITREFAPEQAQALDLRRFAGDTGALFVREGVGLAGRGCAFRIPLHRGTADVEFVRDVLDACAVDDDLERAGSGPVAFGAIPFAPGAPGFLTVPTEVVAKSSDGRAWYSVARRVDSAIVAEAAGAAEAVGVAEAAGLAEAVGVAEPVLSAPMTEAVSPHGFSLQSAVSHPEWCAVISEAVGRIDLGLLDKVVLARAVDVVASSDLVLTDILSRLESLFPSCMVFSFDAGTGADHSIAGIVHNSPVRFIGASPELLVARKGPSVRTHPLAGTIARSGDPETDNRLGAKLLASSKDRWEHSLVIDEIAAVLRPLCDELDVPQEPSIVPLRNVSHLGTRISGTLRSAEVAAGAAPTALELACSLHPTPAVGGVPNSRAMNTIASLEQTPRGYYAGPVGWVDAAGNGEWAVGLRSATVSGNVAQMMAGVGIVADSDPSAELAETQLKLQALLAAIVRP